MGGMLPLSDMPALQYPRELVFDTCKVGVVLRAVLFVQAAVVVGAMFGAHAVWDWLIQVAVLTGAALPATLVWLLAGCALKKPISRLPMPWQWTVGVTLGALAALYGCALMTWMGLVEPSPWLASAASGALLSAVLVAALVWRAKARMPAGTTAQLAELQARIRPHFLFNTLNTAIALVREEPAKAENLLEDLSELFRHALADTQESVPLWQELELAEHYLAIEQVRFGDRLRVEWSVDDAASRAKLPPLILQPPLLPSPPPWRVGAGASQAAAEGWTGRSSVARKSTAPQRLLAPPHPRRPARPRSRLAVARCRDSRRDACGMTRRGEATVTMLHDQR